MNFGRSISEAFGWSRNHYDRLAHIAFGALAMAPMVELAQRKLRMPLYTAHGFGFAFVLAVGGLYEIFEWALTMIVAPELADRYNGQQGDMWDAQKDMALGAAGALAASMILLLVARTGLGSMRER